MLEAFKASHDQAVRNQRAAEAVEASRRIRAGAALPDGATGHPSEGPSRAPVDSQPGVTPMVPAHGLPSAEAESPEVGQNPKAGSPGAKTASVRAVPSADSNNASEELPGSKPAAKPGFFGRKKGGSAGIKAKAPRQKKAKSTSPSRAQGAESPSPTAQPARSRRVAEAKASPSRPGQGRDGVAYADPALNATDEVVLPMGWVPFFGLQLLLLSVAFGLGWLVSQRSQAGTVQAAGPAALSLDGGLVLDSPDAGKDQALDEGTPLRGGRPVSVLGGGAELDGPEDASDSAQAQAADLAFDDPANRFTVVVAQYNDNDFGRERAWDAFQYLVDQGIPAVSPRARNGMVFLFAGAAVERKDLKPVMERVRTLKDKRGREYPFNDAYDANISRFL